MAKDVGEPVLHCLVAGVLMDAGLSSTSPSAPRSRAERRAQALRAESAATDALTVLGHKWVLRIIHELGDRTQLGKPLIHVHPDLLEVTGTG